MAPFKKLDKFSKKTMKFGIQLIIIGFGIMFLIAIIAAVALSH